MILILIIKQKKKKEEKQTIRQLELFFLVKYQLGILCT